MTKEQAIDLIIFEYKRYSNVELPYNTLGEFYDQYNEEDFTGVEGRAMEFYGAVDSFMANIYYDEEDFEEVYKILNIQGVSDMIEFLYEYNDRLN